MKKDRAVLDFIQFPVARKVETGRNVEMKLRSGSIFTNPDVTPDELKAKTDTLEERSMAAMNGGKESTVLLHQAEDDFNNTMRLVVRYVERIADGDPAIILSAGLSLAKQPASPSRPELKVELAERSGSVRLRRRSVEHARSYIWQYTTGEHPAQENDWVVAKVTPQATIELSGLTPLTKHWFRVAAVTIDETQEFCDPVMQVVI